MEIKKPFGDFDDRDRHADMDAPFTFSEIESQVKIGLDLYDDAYLHKSLAGIKIFMLTVSVVTVLSDFKDGLVVGLIAWGVTTIWNWWRWNKALKAYGKYVTDNAKQSGMTSFDFDFLSASHVTRGREFLASLYSKHR
jgi:hypothetical protein